MSQVDHVNTSKCAAEITRMMFSDELSGFVRADNVVVFIKSRTQHDPLKSIILILIREEDLSEEILRESAAFTSLVLSKVNGHINRFNAHLASDNVNNLRIFEKYFKQ